MSCEGNKHLRQTNYDGAMFLDHQLNSLLTAQLVSSVVYHSNKTNNPFFHLPLEERGRY